MAATTTGGADPVGAALGKLNEIKIDNEVESPKDLIASGMDSRSASFTGASSPQKCAHPIIRENAPITPRRYIKALQSMIQQISKHQALFTPDVHAALEACEADQCETRQSASGGFVLPCRAAWRPDIHGSIAMPPVSGAPNSPRHPPSMRERLWPLRP